MTSFCKHYPVKSGAISLTVGIGAIMFSSCMGNIREKQSDKPNIIFIMADDLGYGSLSCYGSDVIQTPNIDQLANEGMLFKDFHSNSPYCSPTRAALLTGRYQQRAVWVADEELSPVFREQRKANMKQRWAWGISKDEVTMAQILKDSGYKTGLIGKWHLGYDFNFHPMNYGFDEFRGFIGGAVDYHSHVATHGLNELDWWKDTIIKNEPGYTTDLLTDYAKDYIERHKDESFFLFISHAAPHDPWQGRDPKSNKSNVETYVEMVEILDESVGKIRKALKDNQIERNTLLIFCSDNGPARLPGIDLNGPLREGKGSLFEGGHRVPFIACFPGKIDAGTISEELTMSMDLFPTFATISGADIPISLNIDGVDISEVFFNQSNVPERTLHWEMDGRWAVRKGDWKLIGTGDTGTEIFNLKEDIGESYNLISEHPEIVSKLSDMHRTWFGEVQVKIDVK